MMQHPCIQVAIDAIFKDPSWPWPTHAACGVRMWGRWGEGQVGCAAPPHFRRRRRRRQPLEQPPAAVAVTRHWPVPLSDRSRFLLRCSSPARPGPPRRSPAHLRPARRSPMYDCPFRRRLERRRCLFFLFDVFFISGTLTWRNAITLPCYIGSCKLTCRDGSR